MHTWGHMFTLTRPYTCACRKPWTDYCSPALQLERLHLDSTDRNSSITTVLQRLPAENWKWDCFKSLFRIYQVKIVIRPPTCAKTYNPQLHCRFLPKNNSTPPSLSLTYNLYYQGNLANKRSSGYNSHSPSCYLCYFSNKTQSLSNLRAMM